MALYPLGGRCCKGVIWAPVLLNIFIKNDLDVRVERVLSTSAEETMLGVGESRIG